MTNAIAKPAKAPAVLGLHWLSPSHQLDELTSRDFGRNIEVSLKDIAASHKPRLLRLRKRPAAVVIATQEYEQLLELKAQYTELLAASKAQQLAGLNTSFDQLFAQIAAPAAQDAALSLFSATSEQLAASFQPGKTETP